MGRALIIELVLAHLAMTEMDGNETATIALQEITKVVRTHTQLTHSSLKPTHSIWDQFR